MKKEDIEKVMKEIINATFVRLQNAYDCRSESAANKKEKAPHKYKEGESRLVFPMYGEHKDNNTRVSEQELRFAFVESFNEYCKKNQYDLFYSVETPTRDKYSGFAKGDPEIAKEGKGRSAEFDMVIYDNYLNRICLVEFKANNADEKDHLKDFIKLNNPVEVEGRDCVLSYFIEVVKSSDKRTYNNLNNKIKKQGNANFFCYDLANGGKDITQDIKEANEH